MITKHKKNERGFTLVELAIALMIIGLLIGGVLKGIELVENARVNQIMRNVKGFETAVTSFQSIYNAIPGDIVSPNTRLPNCGTGTFCFTNNTTGDGNGIVGAVVTSRDVQAQPADVSEPRLFWLHMALANVISGVETTGTASSPFKWGVEYPAAPVVGAGYMVNYLRVAGPPRFQGHFITLRGTAVADGVLTGNQSLQIDSKFDDGFPNTGDIATASSNESITTNCKTGTGATDTYAVDSDSRACVLHFKLSK